MLPFSRSLVKSPTGSCHSTCGKFEAVLLLTGKHWRIEWVKIMLGGVAKTDLRRFTGDFFEKNFLLKFMKNILQYTIDYPNVIYRKKLGVTDSGF